MRRNGQNVRSSATLIAPLAYETQTLTSPTGQIHIRRFGFEEKLGFPLALLNHMNISLLFSESYALHTAYIGVVCRRARLRYLHLPFGLWMQVCWLSDRRNPSLHRHS